MNSQCIKLCNYKDLNIITLIVNAINLRSNNVFIVK